MILKLALLPKAQNISKFYTSMEILNKWIFHKKLKKWSTEKERGARSLNSLAYYWPVNETMTRRSQNS